MCDDCEWVENEDFGVDIFLSCEFLVFVIYFDENNVFFFVCKRILQDLVLVFEVWVVEGVQFFYLWCVNCLLVEVGLIFNFQDVLVVLVSELVMMCGVEVQFEYWCVFDVIEVEYVVCVNFFGCDFCDNGFFQLVVLVCCYVDEQQVCFEVVFFGVVDVVSVLFGV